MLRTSLLGLLLLALLSLTARGQFSPASAADDLVHIKSHVTYDIHPDQGPIGVSWDVDIADNDPATKPGSTGGNISFYDAFPFPILRGAQNVSAHSAGGAPLEVSTSDPGQGPVMAARVKLDQRLFFQDTYSLKLVYEIPPTRQPALLLTSSYAFVPVIASGNEATVDVSAPSSAPWTLSLEPGACSQSGSTFTCSGSDSVYLAALVEVSRPDATAATTAEVALHDKKLAVSITYFQGEEAFAQHLQDLIAAGLPVIEDLYGVVYSGPTTVNVAERGRQVILGYEGLTKCEATSCDIAVSPIADDYTVLHELSHLWSSLYAKRWLQEGFAEFIAEEAAARLPAGLVTGSPPARQQPTVELQLDAWGEVTSIIGAAEQELAVENAGYYRSQRFLALLEFDLGLDALKRTNQALSRAGGRADSRRFMDALEEASGRNNDDDFKEWVFPPSFNPALAQRREARNRLANLAARAQQEGLTDKVPERIKESVSAWHFDEAFGALDKAEAGLNTYEQLKGELEPLRADVADAGLSLTGKIDEQIADWDFGAARNLAAAAKDAVTTYSDARERVEAPRNLWQRFGLLGSDPSGRLDEAASAFNAGDFPSAEQHSHEAIEMIDRASRTATRRVLIVTGGLEAFALVVFAAVWLSHRRQREFA